jgi:hypothetical protein
MEREAQICSSLRVLLPTQLTPGVPDTELVESGVDAWPGGPVPGLQVQAGVPARPDQGHDADHERRDDKHEYEQAKGARPMTEPVAET